MELEPGFDEQIRKNLARKLGRAAPLLERGTVRFEDVNGPRGGVDTLCRIKLVMSGRPSVQVEQVGVNPAMAFALAVPVLVRALERTKRKHGLRAGPAPRGRQHARRAPVAVAAGSIIGRRVGRGPKAQARALARPEKRRRDAYVDTSLPGVSASHRRAGGPTTARRNAMANPRRAASTLEDSRTRPSRKSTRRGANRGKPSQRKERAALSRSMTPSAKAARNVARARR